MEYATFLALREPDWLDFERRLAEAQKKPKAVGYDDLERLAIDYRQILHDNALASARFPGTGAARRLQNLALVATRWLNRTTARSRQGTSTLRAPQRKPSCSATAMHP